MTYRTREVVAERRKFDPVPAFEAVLLENGDHDGARRRRRCARTSCARPTKRPTQPRRCRIRKPADLYTHVYEGAWQPWQS